MKVRSLRFTRVARLFGADGLVLCAIGLSVYRSSSVLDLKAGDCVILPHGDEVVTIEHISCSESYEAEVFTLVDTDPRDASAPLPGKEALILQAESACVESFESYVGTPYVPSSLDITWLLSIKSSWGEGDRQIVCLVNAMGAQPLISSVKDLKL